MHRPVAECDAVAKTVFAGGATELPIQTDVFAFGVGVEARRLHTDADWRSRSSPLHTGTIARQGVVLAVGHRAGL